LEKVSRESALYAIKHIKYGEKLKGNFRNITEATAYHEAGHAVLSAILTPNVKIEQITITPRDDAFGFVSYNNEENFANMTKQDIENKICVLLGGRVAQIRQFGNDGFDSGASSDLSHATHLANVAFAKLGMSEKLGYISLESLKADEAVSLRTEINQEIKELIQSSTTKTRELTDKYWNKIEAVAK